MSKIFLLSKMLSRAGGDADKDSSQNADVLNIFLIIVLAISTIAAGLFLTPISQDIIPNSLLLTFFSVLAALMSLVRVLPLIINSLYMSKNVDIELTLPFTPIQLALSKTLNVIKTEGLYQLAATIPFAFGCFLADSNEIIELMILSILLIFFVTLFVSFFIILAATLIMKAIKTAANREFHKIIGVILASIALIALSCFSFFSRSSTSNIEMNEILTTINNLSSFAYIIPIAPMLRDFVAGINVLNILWVILIDGAIVTLALISLNKFYLPILMQVSNSFSNNQKVTSKTIKQSVKAQNKISALVYKDLRLIYRDSSFYLNGIISPLIVGVFFQIIYLQLIGNLTSTSPYGLTFSANLIIGISMGLIASVGVSSFSGIAACSLSREGESYIFLKQIPINYKTQIKAKRKVALIMTVPFSCVIVIGFSIFGMITNTYSWIVPIAAIITLIPTTVFICNKSIAIDLKKPNLHISDMKKLTSPKTSVSIIGIVVTLLSFFLPVPFIIMQAITVNAIEYMDIILCLVIIIIPAIFVLLAWVSTKNLNKRCCNLINNL